MNDTIDWLRLVRIRGIKKTALAEMANITRDPKQILQKIHILSDENPKFGASIIFPNDNDLMMEFENISKNNAEIITFASDFYPPLLRHISSCPLILIVKGNKELLSKDIFTIVGTRVPAMVSEKIAKRVASELSSFGLVIASGLAKGIDTAAHNGDITRTIAVIGTGIDICYPSQNLALSEKIYSSGGLIITEFMMGIPPSPENFPQRNRILAGLARGVLVVEAKATSGSMITARFAANYDRELYAIPGFPDDKRYSGNNLLIKENIATLVESASDIYNDIRYLLNNDKIEDSKKNPNDIIDLDLFPDTIRTEHIKSILCQKMSSTPLHLNEIVVMIDAPVNIVRIAILELELYGIIERTEDGKFFLLTIQ